jgi:hypothetical protein
MSTIMCCLPLETYGGWLGGWVENLRQREEGMLLLRGLLSLMATAVVGWILVVGMRALAFAYRDTV